MKRILEGKRYDTQTAETVAEWSNDYNMRDFQWCSETLYKTPKGNWFVAGEGGAMSRYARSSGSMTVGGADLRPLTPDEARQWLEEHDFPEALETHFSDEIEDA